ncbi:MAG: hypothetical protein JWR10_3368 [Rubritepida sp.]|nr:hypothetical protein [Rubritepida sp.]
MTATTASLHARHADISGAAVIALGHSGGNRKKADCVSGMRAPAE